MHIGKIHGLTLVCIVLLNLSCTVHHTVLVLPHLQYSASKISSTCSLHYFYRLGKQILPASCFIILLLVYLNGNNAAEGENNIKYANSYPMN